MHLKANIRHVSSLNRNNSVGIHAYQSPRTDPNRRLRTPVWVLPLRVHAPRPQNDQTIRIPLQNSRQGRHLPITLVTNPAPLASFHQQIHVQWKTLPLNDPEGGMALSRLLPARSRSGLKSRRTSAQVRVATDRPHADPEPLQHPQLGQTRTSA